MKMRLWLIALFLILCGSALAQKPRVFITDSKSWEMSGSSGGSGGNFGASVHGGARPQTAEIIKTFSERCPGVVVNNKAEKADYTVVLDHEGGKGLIRRDNKVAVFNKDGDSIISKSTRSLGNAVQDSCEAIAKDWSEKGPRGAAAENTPAPDSPQSGASPELAGTKLNISSQPAGADIEVDGNFVGSTPSSLSLEPGDHSVAVKKSGYKPWSRKMKMSGGNVNLTAELEKAQ
jgi:PEGA domain-containing protein